MLSQFTEDTILTVTGRMLGLFTLLFVAVCTGSAAQTSGCGVAPVSPRTAQPNIFSDQQEMWLGQVEADMTEADVRPIR
jgi:hypothetical protein